MGEVKNFLKITQKKIFLENEILNNAMFSKALHV